MNRYRYLCIRLFILDRSDQMLPLDLSHRKTKGHIVHLLFYRPQMFKSCFYSLKMHSPNQLFQVFSIAGRGRAYIIKMFSMIG